MFAGFGLFVNDASWFACIQISVPFQSATNKVDRVALEKMTLVEVHLS